MRRIILLLVIALIPAAAGMQISAEIKSLIDGYPEYVNYSMVLNDSPQEFKLSWVNSGSVGCLTRIRTDVLKDGELVYTSWSEELPVEAGDYRAFTSYWQPNESGNYTGEVKVYYCMLIYNGPELNFTALISNRTGLNPFSVTVGNDAENIRLKVTSNRDLSQVVVIPVDYPLGWVFESAAFNLSKNEAKTVDVRYASGIWKPESVKMLVTTPDGAYKAAVNYKLQENKGYDIKTLAICGLAFLVIMLAASIVFLHRKYSKISQVSGEK